MTNATFNGRRWLTLKQAQLVLVYSTFERAAAHESNMVWQPSHEYRNEIQEAKLVIDEYCSTTDSTRAETVGEETALAMWSHDE